MPNKFTSLQFIIGIFFSLLAIILSLGYFISESLHKNINIYAAIFFLIFGVLMMLGTSGKEE